MSGNWKNNVTGKIVERTAKDNSDRAARGKGLRLNACMTKYI